MNRVFVLSPANCNGLRARWMLRRNSRLELAQRLRGSGAPVGEVFSFLSALYFRGKLAYASAFARPPANCAGIFVITPSAGLVPHNTMIRHAKLRGFGRVPIHVKNRSYCSALRRSAKRLAGEMTSDCEVILLGSIASGKYLDILRPIFEGRLRVPVEFMGLGDMSRGGLLLRCVKENSELEYIDAAALFDAAGERSRTRKQTGIGLAASATAARPPVTSFLPRADAGEDDGGGHIA
jgi:hypothetical protein